MYIVLGTILIDINQMLLSIILEIKFKNVGSDIHTHIPYVLLLSIRL